MSKYDESIDIMKGLGIILVIIGHMNIWNTFIFSFHMPLFFFLSGMLYKRRGYKELFIYINQRLLIPYLFWASGLTIAAYILTLMVPGMSRQFGNLKQEFRNIILGGGPENTIIVSPAMWYLTATIMAILIYALIERSNYINWMVVICALIGCVLAYKGKMGLYNIVVALIAMPFWHLGFLFRMRKDRLLSNILLGGGISICINYFLNKINGAIHMYRGILGKNSLLFYLNAFCGIFVCICISQLIMKNSKFIKIILINIGRKSLGIMCIHMILIFLLKSILKEENIVSHCIIFASVLFISYIIAFVWEKIYEIILDVIKIK